MIAEGSLTSWLKRPYLDLTTAVPDGDPQTKGLLLALAAVTGGGDRARIHGLYPSAWRRDIVRQARLPAYDLSDPRSLPRELRTPGWELLCGHLDSMPGPVTAQSVRVLWLLHRMLLGAAVLRYSEEPARLDGAHAEVALLRAMARFALGDDEPGFEHVAAAAPPGSWSAVEATYFLSAAAAKTAGDPRAVRRWTDEHRRQVGLAEVDEHDRAKLRSRYHRVRAFVPQLERDLVGTAREMDHAERFAGEMDRDTPDHETEARTLSFAMWESRTKEALIEGDLDLAEGRAWRAVAEAPLRPAGHLAVGQVLVEKGRHAEAAEAYRTAARYGPPETEVAWFMAGQCLEQVGALDAARDSYLSALGADPLGIASLEQLVQVSERLGDAVLRRWAEGRLNELGSALPDELLPYQRYEGALGR